MFAPNFGGSLMRGHKGHPNLVGNICDFNLKKYVRCVLGFPFFHTQTLCECRQVRVLCFLSYSLLKNDTQNFVSFGLKF